MSILLDNDYLYRGMIAFITFFIAVAIKVLQHKNVNAHAKKSATMFSMGIHLFEVIALSSVVHQLELLPFSVAGAGAGMFVGMTIYEIMVMRRKLNPEDSSNGH